MKFEVVVADPPYSFSDRLTMSSVKRGSSANYDTLSNNDIKNLNVEKIVADDAVLALWVPSSLIQSGLDIMKAWGFEQKQTFVWVKHKKEPLKELLKIIRYSSGQLIKSNMINFDLNKILNFGMGRLFRQTHEIALVGTRGKVYDKLQNRSQRSVLLDKNIGHSAKPEGLQDRLDLMFKGPKLEMFARRVRPGWICVGNECPSTMGEDIRDSLENLM